VIGTLENRYLALFQQEIEVFLRLVEDGSILPDKDGKISRLIFKGIELSHVKMVATSLNNTEKSRNQPEFYLKFKNRREVWEVHIFSTQTQTNA
jgi:hypothetical protein